VLIGLLLIASALGLQAPAGRTVASLWGMPLFSLAGVTLAGLLGLVLLLRWWRR
jgi:hypothetical protein